MNDRNTARPAVGAPAVGALANGPMTNAAVDERLAARIEAATAEGSARYGADGWRTRVDLAACYRLVALFGMTDLIANHISARVPGAGEVFLINPYGLMYEEITASSLIAVDLAGRMLEQPDARYSINVAGYVIHSAVHAARADAGCVIHTHTPAGIAISALECGLLPVSQSSMRFAKVGYHDFEGVAFEPGEKERLVADLGDADAMILRNHGLLAVGRTIAQAFNTIYRLERVCQIQWMAMSCASPMVRPPQAVIERANRQYAGNQVQMGRSSPPLGEIEWPAMLRMLDRRDPTFRL